MESKIEGYRNDEYEINSLGDMHYTFNIDKYMKRNI